MPAIPPAWKMCSAFTVRTDWLFYWLQTSWGGSVCESFTLVLETNGLRGIWLRSLVRSLQLHIKVDMGILMSLMVAGNSHSDVCLAVKICRDYSWHYPGLLPLKLSYANSLQNQSKPFQNTASSAYLQPG